MLPGRTYGDVTGLPAHQRHSMVIVPMDTPGDPPYHPPPPPPHPPPPLLLLLLWDKTLRPMPPLLCFNH